ncbi:MAG: hypothetical protein LBK44_04395 [Spirochaetales bacterium]|nr:hypothetical protein [Spirochaetales bacterium]
MPAAGQKNRAFRCKSSDLLMQILWAFRCNPIAPHGLTVAVKPCPQNRSAILRLTDRARRPLNPANPATHQEEMFPL